MDDIATKTQAKLGVPPQISALERARRKAADDYARGSLRLEGLVPGSFSDDMTRRYIDGEITREQLTAAIRAHHGL